jgi:hypothetical protein
MKRTVLLIFVMNALFLAYSNSQDVIASVSSPVNAVKVNLDMIERFNNAGNNPEYLTWRDLITGYDIQSLKDLYQAYINCDFERESMQDIKLALEQKKLEYEKKMQEYDNEYLAKIRNMDIRINVPENPPMIVQNAE